MFTVELAGHGIVRDDGVPPYPVFIIVVQQPIQSWTSYRRYASFKSLGEHLQTTVMGAALPSCPPMNDEMLLASVDQLARARVLLQQWLHQALLYPGVKESAVLRNFLCANANMPPPRLDITWAKGYCPSLDEMEMDELFDRHLEEKENLDSDDDSTGQHTPTPHAHYAAGGLNHHHNNNSGAVQLLHYQASNNNNNTNTNNINGSRNHNNGLLNGNVTAGAALTAAASSELSSRVGEKRPAAGGSGGSGGGGTRSDTMASEDETGEGFGLASGGVGGGGFAAVTPLALRGSGIAQGGIGGGIGGIVSHGGGMANGSGNAYYDSGLDMPNEDDIASSVPIEITFKDPSTYEQQCAAGAAALQQCSTGGTAPPPSAAGSAAPGLPSGGAAVGGARPEKKVGLDSFKIIKVIGKGSFGKVFLVREKTAGDIYAMKVLRKDNVIRRNQVEHTKTERNVLGYVKHPFIVGLNMAFQTPAKLFFVLDYCAGGELFFHLGKLGKFSEPRARFYAAEITLALEHVHKLDIIYRDLKPENVLLDGKGHIRLTDFGLSKEGITDNISGAHSFCGTPEYLAPEILSRQGHGRAVDWWSLGALLYEMLTGLPPFYCQDRERLFDKIRRGPLTYPRFLAEQAQDILQGLLTRDPSRRLGSSAEDAEEVKRHPFFNGIDWLRVMRRDMPVPWEPNVVGSLDTSQFDREFTSMPILSPDSRSSDFRLGAHDNTFEGFTFVDRSSLLAHPSAQLNSAAITSTTTAATAAGIAATMAPTHRPPRVMLDHMEGLEGDL